MTGSPSRVVRLVPTQSYPSSKIAFTISGNNSGGSCKSASITVIKSPVAAFNPAKSADSLPKFREKDK